MAIQMTAATDRHLYSVSTNFGAATDSYSISVWINAVWNGGTTFSFVGMYNGSLVVTPTTGLQIGTTAANVGGVNCWTYGGLTMVASAAGAMTPYNNTWVLITYTYDGTNHRVYRNDTLLATGTTIQNPGTFTQVYINGYPPSGTANETGTYQVDTYLYFGRTLTQPEIATIYQSFGNRHGIDYGLLASYDFDEGVTGATVTGVVDTSGNGNTLLNTGAGTAITYTYAGTVASSNLRMVQ